MQSPLKTLKTKLYLLTEKRTINETFIFEIYNI